MIDITSKNSSLRKATAQAVVKTSSPQTIQAVQENKVPKGNVFEMARAAALLAAKHTASVIPDCHPMPIEYAAVGFEIEDLQIIITAEIKTVYKTGVEMEALYAASVAALTIYDMLKPLDKNMEILHIQLSEKRGGKSDKKDVFDVPLTASVIVCSDSISGGDKEDKAGKVIMEKLKTGGVIVSDYIIIPDEIEEIQAKVKAYTRQGINMVLITGGTGLSKRDVTPEAVKPLLDREIPGIAEAMRNYGQDRTPLSMLSRSIAGFIGETLVIALPGSTKGAEESMDAIFPAVLHVFKIQDGFQH
ncbi:MAG: bifunctional molybdenum cofactor biosynthesis protein MoaC/MoaB [Candidatus Azobacteroides sp.]|nr:bifunctional molybdenum cofactor biosynthesis protein MoaC/MoaB [Candidatus Azobacteroides sp.]